MGLFSSSSSGTCPSIASGPQYGADHIVGSLTFHDLTRILCAAFTVVVYIISGIQLSIHATHFSNPGEQSKIMRIIALVPIFAFVYLIAGILTSDAIYFQPWGDFYESIALASYFLLLIKFVVPNDERRDGFFDRLQQKDGGSSLTWYRRTWVFVFQYIPISFGVAIATDITQAVGVYCANGSSVKFAHIWLTVIRSVSVALAFLRLLAFYKRLRSQVTEHHVVAKLTAIKGIVAVVFLQTIVFTILNSTGAASPSSKLSYNDIYYGIPSILVCGEMVLFALFHLYAYSARPYFIHSGFSAIESNKPGAQKYHGGPLGLKAFLMALNPAEIVGGHVQAVRNLFSMREEQYKNDDVALQPQYYNQHEPTSYDPPHYPAQGHVAPHHSQDPYSTEQGTVNQYTPLPRDQY